MKQHLIFLKRLLQDKSESYCQPKRSDVAGIIGKSKNNIEIPFYKIGNEGRKILLIGAIHGNETGTTKLANRLIYNLKISPIENVSFYIVPTLNVDGYLCSVKNPDYKNGGKVGRFNAENIDLNRNFPTRSFKSKSVWNTGKDYNDKTEVFCGERGASTSEVKALMDFIRKENINYIVIFHNAGKDVTAANDPISHKLADIFSKESGYKVFCQKSWEELGQSGTFKEWCEENKIHLLEIEGVNRWQSDFKNVKKALNKTFRAIGNE